MSEQTLAILTLIGTITSVLSAIIAMRQAILAKRYSNLLCLDSRKRNITLSIKDLQKALEFVRKLPSDSQKVQRGKKTEILIEQIKERFDNILGILPIDGVDEDIRQSVGCAQSALTDYEHSFNTGILSADLTLSMQSPIQEAVSIANNKILKIEGKA